MPGELHLVGTLPNDPDAPDRLRTLLSRLRPVAVAVTGSRGGFERRRARVERTLDDALEGVVATPGHSAASANWLARLVSPRFACHEHEVALRYASRGKGSVAFLEEDGGDEGGVGDVLPVIPPLLVEPSSPLRLLPLRVNQVSTTGLLSLLAHDWSDAFGAVYGRVRADLAGGVLAEAVVPRDEQRVHAGRAERLAGALTALRERSREEVVAAILPVTQLYASGIQLSVASRLDGAVTHVTDGEA